MNKAHAQFLVDAIKRYVKSLVEETTHEYIGDYQAESYLVEAFTTLLPARTTESIMEEGVANGMLDEDRGLGENRGGIELKKEPAPRMAFVDMTCSKCKQRFGYLGDPSDPRGCPNCDFVPSKEHVDATRKAFAEYEQKRDTPHPFQPRIIGAQVTRFCEACGMRSIDNPVHTPS